MKIVLFAVAAIVILGGGGAGAYFYFKQPAEAAVGETEEHQETADAGHGKKEKGKGGDGHGEGGSVFVELAPLVLPIIDEKGISQVVSLVVVIEVSDAHKADTVKTMTPKLKDAYIQDMYGVLSKRDALKGGVLQVGDLKERLNAASQRVMGEGVVDDVLLQVVQQRPM